MLDLDFSVCDHQTTELVLEHTVPKSMYHSNSMYSSMYNSHSMYSSSVHKYVPGTAVVVYRYECVLDIFSTSEKQEKRQGIRIHTNTYHGTILTLLEPQSRFGDKSLNFQIVCPQNGTGALKGLTHNKNSTRNGQYDLDVSFQSNIYSRPCST